jgi:hypothetical protein
MKPLVGLGICLFLGSVSSLGYWTFSRTRPADNAVPADRKSVASSERNSSPRTNADDGRVRIQFRDLAKSAGVTFKHQHSRTDMHYVPEIMGGGVAWIDYDQDGYVDVLFIQGGSFPPDPREKVSGPTSRLYRNLGDGTFVDVTADVGLVHPGFGQGVAVGDYDNDGYPDLFITCYEHVHLFHNEPDSRGGRRFREVTDEAGVKLNGWCTSCGFADIHANGFLDLFVCRYVKMDLAHYPFCGAPNREPPLRESCGPREFRGNSCVLFRNNGNGTFTNVSRESGLEAESKGLGVLLVDFDDDGKTDIFVGNDELPNDYYHNLGGGKLQSCGVLSGTASNSHGGVMGSMGLEAGDVSGSGRPDIFVTTYWHEGTTLFRNNGNGLFTDVSIGAGMQNASYNKVGWGTCFIDADLDGALDIFVANGHVYRNALEILAKNPDGEPHTYEQPAQFFLGNGKGLFHDISRDAGPYFRELHVGRGAAMCDYDNDGAMDIAINNCGESAALLHNETETPNHWIRLQLEGARARDPQGSNRDAIGARVTLRLGDLQRVYHIKGGGSYLSASDRRLLIGLGSVDQVDDVEVRWPNANGTVQHFGPLKANQSYKLEEGQQAMRAKCPPVKRVLSIARE